MTDQKRNPFAYRALREAVPGLSQRALERELGWEKRGRLSMIERGLVPTRTEHEQLMAFFVAHMPNAHVVEDGNGD